MSTNENAYTELSVPQSKPQRLRGVFRGAHTFFGSKYGRDTCKFEDIADTRSSKKSETKQRPSNQGIQETMHEYDYPDVSLLRKEFSRPPAPDISTLPKRKENRNQVQRKGNKLNYLENMRSLSVPDLSDREKEISKSKTIVSMKARLFESLDQNKYLQPVASPKQAKKRFIPPCAKPHSVQSFPVKPIISQSCNVTGSGNYNGRNFLPSNLSKTTKKWPNPLVPRSHISNANSPPHNVDTEVVSVNPVKERLSEIAQIKTRPVGKVVGKITPFPRESEEKQPYSSGKLFSELSVVELVECLRKCGLGELADVCQSEKFDGSFIIQLSREELKELNLSSVQIMKLNKVKRGGRPKTTDFH